MVRIRNLFEDLMYSKTELESVENVRDRLDGKSEHLFALLGPQDINLDAEAVYEKLEDEKPNKIIHVEKPLGKWEIRLEYQDGTDRLTPSRGGNAYNGKKEGENQETVEERKYNLT